MSINISYLAGAGAQFFDSNGEPLSGGLLYTFAAGTTTPVSTYTSRSGAALNTNPIVLDAAGRTPAEIWLDGGVLYKFVLKNSAFVQIGSYDNIPAVNDPTTTNNLITVAGTNALTGLATPPLEGYTAGAQYSFIAQNTNTGAVTLDIDSLGVKAVTRSGAVALVAGDIIGGAMILVEYDGTRFQLLNPNSFTNTQITSLGVGTAPSGTTGEIRATNNVTAYFSSDKKFKTNIAPVQNALEKIKAIGTKTFDWTDEYIASKGGEDFYFVQKNDFGVIAQDVQKVFPQAVRTREDGSLAVDYEKLSTLSFQALIELSARVEALEVK
jgi:hypothetical protein